MDPLIIVFLVTAFILVIAYFIRKHISDADEKSHREEWQNDSERIKKIRGRVGENNVSRRIETVLAGKKYELINGLTLKDGGGESQIDHILINKYGVFVIETKNWSGTLYGKDSDDYWAWTGNTNRETRYNPIKQNETHCRRIASLLKSDRINIFNVVVFVSGDISNIESKRVFSLDEFENVLKNPYAYYPDKRVQNELSDKWIDKNSEILRAHYSFIPEKEHIEYVEKKKQLANTDFGTCPLCGKKLALRTGKRGKFLGCYGYPECKYTKEL